MTPNGDLSYSGDTFIRVRSGKHHSSTAFTHAYDLRELFLKGCLPEKPILLMETDGAQDEAPRFPKPLSTAVSLFKQMKLFTLSTLPVYLLSILSNDEWLRCRMILPVLYYLTTTMVHT